MLKTVDGKTGLGRFAPEAKQRAAAAVQQLRDEPDEVLRSLPTSAQDPTRSGISCACFLYIMHGLGVFASLPGSDRSPWR